MTMNEGTIDRALRIVVGLGLLSIVVVGPQTMWGLIGVVPLTTGLIGVCPMYSLFGLSSCPMRKSQKN